MSVNISKPLSDMMSASRSLMIYGLVVHHLFTIPNTLSFPRHGLHEYSFFLPEAIAAFFHMAFMASVPMLSIISGYLFFSAKQFDYVGVLKKKFLTIALPSWLWCFVWLVVAFGLYWVGHDRGMFEWANYSFDEFSVLAFLNGIVGVTDMQFAFQFWFVHDLILTFLLFPLIKWLLDFFGVWFVAASALVWFFVAEPPVFFSLNVLFFFVLGAYLATSDKVDLKDFFWSISIYRYMILIVFVLLLLCRSLTYVFFEKEALPAEFFQSGKFLLVLRIFGVLAFAQIIYLFSIYCKPVFDFLKDKSVYAFLVFAMHYPIIEFFKIIVARLPGQESSVGIFLTWLLVPVITVVSCIIAAKLLYRLMPGVFSLLNGGRQLK